MSAQRYHLVLLVRVASFFVWSGIMPHDTRLTWVLETFPVMIAVPALLLTYHKFPLTNLTYTLITIHALILMLGGHYSYARVPLGFWMEDWFGWTMFWCLVGSLVALILLTKMHNESLRGMVPRSS